MMQSTVLVPSGQNSPEPMELTVSTGQPASPRYWLAGWVISASMATCVAVGVGTAPPAARLIVDATQSSASPVDIGNLQRQASEKSVQRTAPITNTADLVRTVRSDSGLTWEQLSQILGVSRRAAHLWASGGKINARNLEMVSALGELLRAAPTDDPEGRRAWLFASLPGERSPIEQLKEGFRHKGPVVAGSGYTASELVGKASD